MIVNTRNGTIRLTKTEKSRLLEVSHIMDMLARHGVECRSPRQIYDCIDDSGLYLPPTPRDRHADVDAGAPLTRKDVMNEYPTVS